MRKKPGSTTAARMPSGDGSSASASGKLSCAPALAWLLERIEAVIGVL